jgi:uncharacterized membrane protein (DUF2068 family)
MPFEVVALVRHATGIRVALLVLNAVIVWYLARLVIAERRHHDRGPQP